MGKLDVRSREEEQMDGPDLDPVVYEKVLHDLARVNRVTFTAWPTLTAAFSTLLTAVDAAFSTLLTAVDAAFSTLWKVLLMPLFSLSIMPIGFSSGVARRALRALGRKEVVRL